MNRIVSFFVNLFVRFMPDAFVVALLLTAVTATLAIFAAGQPLDEAVTSWGDGFWDLLAFTNQITLTLLLGYAFANTPPIRRLLLAVARRVRTPFGAYALACGATAVCALFSWGLSLIAAGILARALGEACHEKGIEVDYPLLVASAFSGFVIWHQGLSSSIGLVLATPGHFLEAQVGVIAAAETLFTPWNLGLALFVLLTLPLVMASLRPRGEREAEPIPEHLLKRPETTAPPRVTPTPAQWLEDSRLLSLIVVAAGGLYLWTHFVSRGNGLDLDTLNFTFLMAGVLLAGSPLAYARIIVEGGRVAAPFLLQYPFYAGIAALMRDSGLAQMVVDFFVSVATPTTLPFFGFLSGGVLNLFIPSGGGQWAVQGPIMMSAAQEIGADLPRTAMAVALGDQWTNLIQPLAIVPVLTIAGLSVRQIMGYTFIALVYSGLVFSAALLLF